MTRAAQRLVVTGAGGFLGRALVARARSAGAEVLALTRGSGLPDWAGDAGITPAAVDLGAVDAPDRLAPLLVGADVVIHAAASFAGDAATHRRDTIDATRHLLAALTAAPVPPRLILVSSLSVYDVAAMSDYATLDETSPLVREPGSRDVYAAAKVAQEDLVREIGLAAYIIRPGVIYGPGRLWNAQLGFARGGLVVCPGGDIPVPAIHVDHAAASLIRAALAGQGADVINLIDPDPPTQAAWLTGLGLWVVRVPRGLVLATGRTLGRGSAWQARFRPLHYDITRATEKLGHTPDLPFTTALTSARLAEQDTP